MSEKSKPKLSTEVKENETTTETLNNEEPDAVGTPTGNHRNLAGSHIRVLSGNNLISSQTEVSDMSSSQSPQLSSLGSSAPVTTTTESKIDSQTISAMGGLTISVDGPAFETMLGTNHSMEYNDDDSDEDEDEDDDDSEDDPDLPQGIPGGMPIGFMGMGNDDDDDLPTMTPGLHRQNAYYRSETSRDFIAMQRAA